MKKKEHIKTIKQRTYLLSKDKFIALQNEGDFISYKSFDEKDLKINKAILVNLIKEDAWFDYFNNIIDNQMGVLHFSYLIGDNLGESIYLNVTDAIKLLDNIKLSENSNKRLESIKKKCDLNTLLDNGKDECYSLEIEEKIITMNVNSMLNFMLLDEDTFKEGFSNVNIMGVKKEYFAYVLDAYLKHKQIFQRYIFPDEIINRYNKLIKQKYVNFEYLSFYDSFLKKYNVKLNDNLKKIIYAQMDNSYNDLEKSIYIYIKLCKSLSYDTLYYISGQRGMQLDFHRNPNRIETIEDGTNEIVCYEFNAIYGKFLDDLNIKYTINSKMATDAYGRGHVNLKYNVDKCIVFADAVTSIIGGDLVNAKLNLDLEGLKCVNLSEDAKLIFNKALVKVYKDIKDNEKYSNKQFKHGLNDINVPGTKIEDKIELMIDLVEKSGLKIVDSMGYLMKLRREIFTKEELLNDLDFSIIRKDFANSRELCMVISKKENDAWKYWCYIPKKGLIRANKFFIKQLIKFGVLSEIEGTNRVIPGIGPVKRR